MNQDDDEPGGEDGDKTGPDKTGRDGEGDGSIDAGAQDESYRDDAPGLDDSSDFAQGRPVGQYSGGGTDTSTEPAPRPQGSQDWRQGSKAANDPSDEPPATTADDPSNDVHSRSADPGQGSYGGFKNEGPSEQASHEAKPDPDAKGDR